HLARPRDPARAGRRAPGNARRPRPGRRGQNRTPARAPGAGIRERDAAHPLSDLTLPLPTPPPLAGEGAVTGYRRDALPLPPRPGIAPFTGGKVGMGAGGRDAAQSHSDLTLPRPNPPPPPGEGAAPERRRGARPPPARPGAAPALVAARPTARPRGREQGPASGARHGLRPRRRALPPARGGRLGWGQAGATQSNPTAT